MPVSLSVMVIGAVSVRVTDCQCTKAIFYSNPNRPENFVKLYSVFQKLDHLTCIEFKLQRSSLTSLN